MTKQITRYCNTIVSLGMAMPHLRIYIYIYIYTGIVLGFSTLVGLKVLELDLLFGVTLSIEVKDNNNENI